MMRFPMVKNGVPGAFFITHIERHLGVVTYIAILSDIPPNLFNGFGWKSLVYNPLGES